MRIPRTPDGSFENAPGAGHVPREDQGERLAEAVFELISGAAQA